ncbi:NTE family protein [Spirosomataceae bacterium TFI 002]|nr:NTE family protein [Spirosomataceae bacterium TFI 002]
MSNLKIGLCLSGGGSRGFAHLGVLQAMDELGIKPTMISGSSAGALVAAIYAQGVSPQDAFEQLSKISVVRNLRFAFNKFGLFKLDKATEILKKMVPHNSFEGLKIPIAVCATHIGKGKATYFTHGELCQAVMASCAIPGLFSPVNINGKKFVDGGIIDNLPLEPLKETCNYFIGVNITPFERKLPVRSAKDIFLKSLYISIDHQTREKAREFDLMIEPKNIVRFNGLSMKRAQEIFDTGYQEALVVLKDLKNMETK